MLTAFTHQNVSQTSSEYAFLARISTICVTSSIQTSPGARDLGRALPMACRNQARLPLALGHVAVRYLRWCRASSGSSLPG
jgi:hypothetical protein